MVHLRATQAVLKLIKVKPTEAAPPANALGDWFVHRFVWRRQPLLILMSQASRLTMLVPARDLCELPGQLPKLVQRRLEMLHRNEAAIQHELHAMGPTVVARTNDRGTLSAINQFLVCAEPSLDHFDGDLASVQAELGRTLLASLARGDETPPN